MKIFKQHGSKERLFEIFQKVNNINEEFVTRIKLFNWDYDVYKNPKTLAKLKSDIRGISTPEGDLYVVDTTEIIHSMFSFKMKEKGFNFPEEVYYNKNYITWVRYDNTNNFYLGESYEINDKKNEIEELNKQSIENVKNKNPQFTFILKLINQA